jgi:dienelactone hydrolase
MTHRRRRPRSTREPTRPVGRSRAAGQATALGVAVAASVLAAWSAIAAARAATHRPSGPAVVRAAASIGVQTLTLIDRTRLIALPHRPPFPRKLVTIVRFPQPSSPSPPGGPTGPTGAAEARGARGPGPLPLIVFAHGYNLTPTAYDALLDAWTRAGYVVAAPVFPRESRGALGGATRSDLANEPSDVSFVVGQLLGQSAEPGHRLSGRIAPGRIAVAGHSDGGIVALAVAYDRYSRDRRIRATVVLSGARPGDGGLQFGPGSPPLLASVGTADPLNPPINTLIYYRRASRPKFLLQLMGASHLPPFAYAQPWLAVVQRVSTAFLDAYLKPRGPRPSVPSFGRLPGSALLLAQP